MTTIQMQRKPLNVLNLEFIQELTETLVMLKKQGCQGMILTSGHRNVFSAGLDIKEMYKPDPERLMQFIGSLQSLFVEFYSSKMATVALINGHAPAAGCLLALCCDYRVMVDGAHAIGLNESRLGIVVPPYLKDASERVIGARSTELMLQLGLMYSPKEAASKGLVDEVASSLEDAREKAVAALKQLLEIPTRARYSSKLLAREDVLKRIVGMEGVERKVAHILRADTQSHLHAYLEGLKKNNN